MPTAQRAARPRKAVVAAAVSAVLALAASGASAAEVQSSQFYGDHAEAVFQRTVDACTTRTVYLLASAGRASGSAPGLTRSASLFVFFTRVDHCVFGSDSSIGIATLDPGALEVRGDLGAATLTARVEHYDFKSGELPPLDLHLTWRATEPPQRDRLHFRSRGPDGSLRISRTALEIRDAVASGRIWDGTDEWAAGADPLGADIASTRLGLVTIDR